MTDYDRHDYFNLYNDNMWSTSLLFLLSNSENYEDLEKLRECWLKLWTHEQTSEPQY